MIEKMLSYFMKDNQKVLDFQFLRLVLKDEDFIIYHYLTDGRTRGYGIDKSTLETMLQNHADDWLNRRSILYNDNLSNLNKETLGIKVNKVLLNKRETANALVNVVMQRYDLLMKIDTSSIQDPNTLRSELEESVRYIFGQDLIRELVWLSNNDMYAYGIRFKRGDIINYTYKRMEYLENSFSNNQIFENPLEYMNSKFEQRSASIVPVFTWNIGKYNPLQAVGYGQMISVVGQKKVGKTKFCLGEMVYPAIMEGKNVFIISTELILTKVTAILTTKHIYAETGFKIPAETCEKVIALTVMLNNLNLTMDRVMELSEYQLYSEELEISQQQFRMLKANKSMLNWFSTKLNQQTKELVLTHYMDLITNEELGKFYVSDDPKDFIIDDYEIRMRNVIKTHNIDMILVDHAGYFKTERPGKNEVNVIKDVYQQSALLAKTENACFVVVNHIETTAGEKASNKINENTEYRAHGTTEAGKSASLEIVLLRDQTDIVEGLVSMIVTAVREQEMSKAVHKLEIDYIANSFKMMADEKTSYRKAN